MSRQWPPSRSWGGCAKESSLKLNTGAVQLHSLDTYTITCDGVSPTFSSRNPYIAEVDDDGEITAYRIGETYIDVSADSGSASVKVTVTPRYDTYSEPCLDWGMTTSEILKKFGEPDMELSGGLAYTFSTKHLSTIYRFENDKLASVYVLVGSAYYSELMLFLAERYVYAGQDSGIDLFINALDPEETTMAVGVTKYPGYSAYMALYRPYSSVKAVHDDMGWDTDRIGGWLSPGQSF